MDRSASLSFSESCVEVANGLFSFTLSLKFRQRFELIEMHIDIDIAIGDSDCGLQIEIFDFLVLFTRKRKHWTCRVNIAGVLCHRVPTQFATRKTDVITSYIETKPAAREYKIQAEILICMPLRLTCTFRPLIND